MFLIKPCPSCGKKLRFPIDKGKIKVKCVCGEMFTADPDNTALYRDAEFDLAAGKKSSSLPGLKEKIEKIKNINVYKKIITGVLGTKYKIQNFRLLPVAEQRKLIFYIMISFIILAIIVMIFFSGGKTIEAINDPTII